MSVISRFSNLIKAAFEGIVERFRPAVQETVEKTVMSEMRREGHTVADIVDTIAHAEPERIAEKLNQTARTVARLIDTEPHVMNWDKDKLLPRNLIVSGRLKAARNYRVFYQADVLDLDGNFLERRWFSFYTNTQKAFADWEEDIYDQLEMANYENYYAVGNISFHHVIHQRGAGFYPVQ